MLIVSTVLMNGKTSITLPTVNSPDAKLVRILPPLIKEISAPENSRIASATKFAKFVSRLRTASRAPFKSTLDSPMTSFNFSSNDALNLSSIAFTSGSSSTVSRLISSVFPTVELGRTSKIFSCFPRLSFNSKFSSKVIVSAVFLTRFPSSSKSKCTKPIIFPYSHACDTKVLPTISPPITGVCECPPIMASSSGTAWAIFLSILCPTWVSATRWLNCSLNCSTCFLVASISSVKRMSSTFFGWVVVGVSWAVIPKIPILRPNTSHSTNESKTCLPVSLYSTLDEIVLNVFSSLFVNSKRRSKP